MIIKSKEREENEMKRESKFIIKKIWLISIIIFITVIILSCFFKIKFFIFGINPNFLYYILFLISIICPIVFFCCEKEDMLLGKLIYTITMVLIIAISMFIYMFLFSGNKYFTFKSTQRTNDLVIEEKSFLLSGISTFYEKKFGVFIKPLDIEINIDDGFRPFSTDSYEINWIDEDTVNVRYNYGNEDVWKSEIIKLK